MPTGLLILGTSHVGKSTIAARLGQATKWPVIATDSLGRHPGRPWTGVPEPVLAFYVHLTGDTIDWFLRAHHQNMRPLIGAAIATARAAGHGFIMEGSALRPEYLDGWNIGEALTVCLYARPDMLRERIRAQSAYTTRSDRTRLCIDKFAERSIRDGQALVASARRHRVPVFEVRDQAAADRVVEALTGMLDNRQDS